MLKFREFLAERLFLVIGIVVLFIALASYFIWPNISRRFGNQKKFFETSNQKVSVPAIVDGELVLPKLYNEGVLNENAKIRVLSAFLVGVFEEKNQQQSNPFLGISNQEPPKLVGIRILGEVKNISNGRIAEVSPVIKFYDEKDKLIGQKIAKLSPNFDFFGFGSTETVIYDVIVDDPPVADKLEILFNPAKGEKKASFEMLKVIDSSIDVKTAKYREQQEIATESGEATLSAQDIATPTATTYDAGTGVEYYTLSGSIRNNLVDPVSDVAVYAWVKDQEGKVFSFGRQDFKGDLISPKDTVKFKINLLPFRMDEKMATYGVAVYGKRYKL